MYTGELIEIDTATGEGTLIGPTGFDSLAGLAARGGIEVGFDIKPGSCPNALALEKSGPLRTALLGSEDFDVYEVDIASVRLEGVPALRSSFRDVATPSGPLSDEPDCYEDCTRDKKDGYPDLTSNSTLRRLSTQLTQGTRSRSAGVVPPGGC